MSLRRADYKANGPRLVSGSETADSAEVDSAEADGKTGHVVDVKNADSDGKGMEVSHEERGPIDSAPSDSFLVVAIGASAGGLEAFQAFFSHMNEDSGMAFVLISHLAPDHDSLLSELIGKETQMSVLQVQSDTHLEPDNVYVIPPNATLTVNDGVLQLSTPAEARGHRAPINTFFRSLSEDQGENAVCVILSGSGSDGTLGLKSIKEFGGLAIVQDPATAKYDSMPRNAITTGLIDYVLPVEEIPAKLIDYNRHRDGLRKNFGEEGILNSTADHLTQICSLLRRRIGHDFSGYKQNTLTRRIQRRIQITQQISVAAYLNYLQADTEEINLLFKDLLIGVTHFFRDPEAFEELRDRVVSPLVERSDADNSLRVWVAGCSSGEEVYSIAMLLLEEMEKQEKRFNVQIFATDIDERALEKARQACYPENITEQITPERLERFFVKQNNSYQVTKQLREVCIFSQHSLINDPPFSRLDLVSCQNLLIYFDTELQKKIIPLFHYALNRKGYLFLGSSENLTGYSELFRNVDKPNRLFQKKQAMIPPRVDFPLVQQSSYRHSQPATLRSNAGRQQVSKTIERLLLQDYAPACVIVNDQNEIVYFFGRTGKYLEPSQGLPSNNLFDLARRGLRLDLRTAIQEVKKSRAVTTRENVSLENEGRVQLVNLIIRPVREMDESGDLLMVIFKDMGKATSYDQARARGNQPKDEAHLIAQLENELRTTREHLRSTIEELETSNEELKSANEELLSMNEELQSSNEELQTSKEEMQSINEELQTVNSELRNKVEELDTVNNDVQNLFESTRIATIFLNLNFRIKKFTPAVTELFHFLEGDAGRPITDMALDLEGTDLTSDIREVLRSLIPVEREVQIGGRDAQYTMRIMPYRTVENVIDGTVITFVEVTRLYQARHQAEQAAQRQRAIAELGTYALQNSDTQAICDRATTLICQTLAGELCSLFVRQSEMDKQSDNGSSPDLLLRSGSGWSGECIGTETISAEDSHPAYVLSVQQPVMVEDFSEEIRFSQSDLLKARDITSGIAVTVYGASAPYGVLTVHTAEARSFTADDVSFLQAIANDLGASLRREENAKDLAESMERLDLALDTGKMGVWELDIASGLSRWNRMEYKLLELSPDMDEQPSAEMFARYIHPEDRERVEQEIEAAIEDGTEFSSEFRINCANGQLRWLAAQARIIYDDSSTPKTLIGINYDITEHKQNTANLQAADKHKDDFLAALGHELRNPLNALNSSLAMMEPSQPPERVDQLRAIAQRQLKLLNRLTSDLLDVSRVTHGKVRVHRQSMNLLQLLRNLLEDNQLNLSEKSLTLETRLPDHPIWINGDRARLVQAFSNVLRNAIKFSNETGRISVSAVSNSESVSVTVADTGIGIEEGALSRIFTAFNQEERSLARSGGLGLGLAVTKGIVDLHEGRIRANSPGLGQGAMITIELPLLPEAAAQNHSLQTAPPHSDKSISSQDTTSVRTPAAADRPSESDCILIVEDDDDSALVIQFFLDDLGYQIRSASNGETGLALAQQFEPAIIISDIGLTSAMDGYAFAQAIRADANLEHVYLIAASGYGQPEDKEKAEAAGFDIHLTKPIKLRKLRQIIVTHLSQRG